MINQKAKITKRDFTDIIEKYKQQTNKTEKDFENECRNRLIYGQKAIKISRKGKASRLSVFYLLEDNLGYLQWLSGGKDYTNARINLKEVHTISHQYTDGISNKVYANSPLIVLQTPSYNVCIVFPETLGTQKRTLKEVEYERDQFHYAVQNQIMNEFENLNNKGADQAEELTQKFFLKADKDGSKQLDFAEFNKEFQKLHTNLSAKKLKEFFNKYDKDGSKCIDEFELKCIFRDMLYKREVLQIYIAYSKLAQDLGNKQLQSKVSNEQVTQLNNSVTPNNKNANNGSQSFSQTKNNKKNNTNNNKSLEQQQEIYKDYYKLMTLDELIEFMKHEQGEIFSTQEEENKLKNEYKELIKTSFKDTYYEDLKEQESKQDQNKIQNNNNKDQEIQQKKNDMYNIENNISLYQFHNILFKKNKIFNPKYLKEYQSMNKPLTDYYCNSSHNTYLLGNQLTGKSSVDAYTNAFLKGSRCVELDIWDDKASKNPIITHGNTLTSKITFEDVIKCIAKNAFEHSDYPLVLSFENHCSGEYQKKMAQIINKYLNQKDNKLVYQVPRDALTVDHYTTIDKLKRKIVIKGKAKLKDALNKLYKDLYDKEQKKKEIKDQIQKGDFNLKQMALQLEEDTETFKDPKPKQIPVIIPYSYQTGNQNTQDNEEQDNKEESDEIDLIDELFIYISMFGSKFNIPEDRRDRSIWEISSLAEGKLNKLQKKHKEAFIQWHKLYFSRIYPFGLRFDSSNYDPFPGLLSGSQIVALNVQTNDQALLTYLGMFQQNGGINSGYILKPRWMRYGEKLRYQEDFKIVQQRLHITVISGQFLRPFDYETNVMDVVDPFVEISIKGTVLDTQNNKTQSTHVIDDNGYNPVWTNDLNNTQKTTFSFDIRCPELAQVVIQVFDKDVVGKEKLGWYSLPFQCLQQGYRIVPLKDQRLDEIENSTLMLHVEIENVAEKIYHPIDEKVYHKEYFDKQFSLNSKFQQGSYKKQSQSKLKKNSSSDNNNLIENSNGKQQKDLKDSQNLGNNKLNTNQSQQLNTDLQNE